MPVYDVICPGCNGKYHETQEKDGYITLEDGSKIRNPFVQKFDPACPNAAMFRLKEPYVSYGWTDFPKDPSLSGDMLECPECGTPYCNGGGKLVRYEKQAVKRVPLSMVQEETSDVV